MNARYTFAVTFHLTPDSVELDPNQFETRMTRPADPPGDEGWMFFRDNLWRGAITDPDHLRRETASELGVPVLNIEYKAFITDQAYWDAFREAIAADLTPFRADSVTEVIAKYLGSSVERRP